MRQTTRRILAGAGMVVLGLGLAIGCSRSDKAANDIKKETPMVEKVQVTSLEMCKRGVTAEIPSSEEKMGEITRHITDLDQERGKAYKKCENDPLFRLSEAYKDSKRTRSEKDEQKEVLPDLAAEVILELESAQAKLGKAEGALAAAETAVVTAQVNEAEARTEAAACQAQSNEQRVKLEGYSSDLKTCTNDWTDMKEKLEYAERAKLQQACTPDKEKCSLAKDDLSWKISVLDTRIDMLKRDWETSYPRESDSAEVAIGRANDHIAIGKELNEAELERQRLQGELDWLNGVKPKETKPKGDRFMSGGRLLH